MHHHALGDLQYQRRRVEARLREDVADLGHDLVPGELSGGQVDRHVEHGTRWIPREEFAQFDRVAAGLPEHPSSDGNDQPGFLGQGYELERLHDAPLWVDPTDQRLYTRDRTRFKLDDRLPFRNLCSGRNHDPD